eukprot:TRINITY_DN44800_c0_g1_i1.p1 TRINITY_DN44800_c0_g1~~TRINITY_DN44800_c0_g1_i1.p1  ORF type:complete len:404 (-),score=62.39 TRINITY_DN44800_c0_g1_i1:644-1855(-)
MCPALEHHAAPSLDKILELHLWDFRRHTLGLHCDLVPKYPSEPSSQVAAVRLISRFLACWHRRQLLVACRYFRKIFETLCLIHGEIHHPGILKQRWHRFYESSIKHIRAELLSALPQVDKIQAANLNRDLCSTTSAEQVVDFSNVGAQTGYIAKRLHMRSMYLVSIFLLPEITRLRLELFAQQTIRIVNVGGGPGFEAVGLQLLADFFGEPVRFIHRVVDIEGSWADAVRVVDGMLRRSARVAQTTMSFSTGDLRRMDVPLCECPENVHLFIFQYVCVENAEMLRSAGFAQLRVLFAAAAIGCCFAFLDSSDRLWPNILQTARATGAFEATFVYVCGKVRMLIQRVTVVSASSVAREAPFLQLCSAHADAHEQRAAKRADKSSDHTGLLSEEYDALFPEVLDL